MRRPITSIVLCAALGALTLVATPLAAQGDRPNLAPATALEQAGHYQQAAAAYEQVLRDHPTYRPALYALERVLRAANALPELVPYMDSALARSPRDPLIYSLVLRVWGDLGNPDSVTATGRRWVRADPKSVAAYREWAFAVAQLGDLAAAQRVLEEGRQQIGGHALAQELAQVAMAMGDWAGAARAWLAVATSGSEAGGPSDAILSATLTLQRTPPALRDSVVTALLTPPADTVAREIAGLLLAGWGRADEGWVQLEPVLPAARAPQAQLLGRFSERARAADAPAAQRARGYALERLAKVSSGPAAQRARIEAARAFADAGDRTRATQLLSAIANDTTGPPDAVATMAMLIGVNADAGRPEEAERRLDEWRGKLAPDEVSSLSERIAWAWIREGALDRADHVLAGDSSVSADGVRGWIALYHGDLAGANAFFKNAGPYAGTRADATARTEVLALVARLPADTVPALGEALLDLAQGDTARAVTGLVAVAGRVGTKGGAADLLTYAGRLAAARGDSSAEEILLRAFAADTAGASAPAAELQLGRFYLEHDRAADAKMRLEHLILAYPESAVVPEARRLLDQARGAIPKS